jgi:hypothetical protein
MRRTLLAGGAVLLLAGVVRAQVLNEQTAEGASGVISEPTTVLAPVTMTKELKAQGGVISSFIQSGDVQANTVDAGSVRANTATLGAVDAGTITASSLTVTGETTTGSLEVMGATTFRERPTGVVLGGSLVKAAATGLSVGCSVFGTVPVPGALVGDACVPSSIPTSALTLGITYDCYVTAPATVTLRSCGLVALVSAPAGTYQVRVIGP